MAGSITTAHSAFGLIHTVVNTCVGDSGTGSFPDTVLPAIEGTLRALATTPGGTQPTALYDVTVVDQYGHDVLEGVGANRSATVAEKVPILYSGTGTHPTVDDQDTLTLKIANNSVDSAQITVTLYYAVL